MKLVIQDRKLVDPLRRWTVRERIAARLSIVTPPQPLQLVIEISDLDSAVKLLRHLEKLCGRQTVVLQDGTLYIGGGQPS